MEQINFRCGIADYLEMKKKQSPMIASERASLINDFVLGINRTRPITYEKDGKTITKGKITPKAVAVKVGHLKHLSDLYYLKSICEKAPDFAKCFFGSLKVSSPTYPKKKQKPWKIPENF